MKRQKAGIAEPQLGNHADVGAGGSEFLSLAGPELKLYHPFTGFSEEAVASCRCTS